MTVTETAVPVPARAGFMRRMYDWVLAWADSRYATLALAVLAFTESSFFPIPPDVLLIALCMGAPKKAYRYALICSVASVLGGMLGYAIGYTLEPVGRWIITHVANAETFDVVAGYYREEAFFYILLAAFTPIPYKVFTIAAGMFHDSVPLSTLVLASVIGRSARFFLVAFLIHRFGPSVKRLIDRYFDRLMWAFLVLLLAGFAAIKYMGSDKPLTADSVRRALQSHVVSERVLMEQRIEKAVGHDFGFNTDLAADDPANAEAMQRIEAWLSTLPPPPEDGG